MPMHNHGNNTQGFHDTQLQCSDTDKPDVIELMCVLFLLAVIDDEQRKFAAPQAQGHRCSAGLGKT